LSGTGACELLGPHIPAVDTWVVIHVARPRHKHVKQEPPAPRPPRRRLARRGLAVAAVFAVTTPVAAVVWPLEGTVVRESVPTAADARSQGSSALREVTPPFEPEAALEAEESPAGTADRKPPEKTGKVRSETSRRAKGRGAKSAQKVTSSGTPRDSVPVVAAREGARSVRQTSVSAGEREAGSEASPVAPTGAAGATKSDPAAANRPANGAKDPAAAPEPTPQTAQEPSPRPTPQPAPQPAPAPAPSPMPEPTADPMPTPEPEPAPEPMPAPVSPAGEPCVPPSDWWLVVESAGPDAVCTLQPE